MRGDSYADVNEYFLEASDEGNEDEMDKTYQANEQEQQTPRIIADNFGAFVEISVSTNDFRGIEQTIAHFSVYGGVELYHVSTGSEPQRFSLTDQDMHVLIAAYQQHVAIHEAEAARRVANDELPF